MRHQSSSSGSNDEGASAGAIHYASILLVEGRDDSDCIFHLLRRHKIEMLCKIQAGEGYPRILAELKIRLKLAEPGDHIGIVVDADDTRLGRWDSIANILRQNGYTVEKLPTPSGTVLKSADNRITVGIWLMPDNSSAGAVESFAEFLIPPDDLLWPHAEAVIQDLPQRAFAESAAMKARMHSWLAWQKDPGCNIGAAITRGFLSADVAEAILFVDWVKRLFDLDSAS